MHHKCDEFLSSIAHHARSVPLPERRQNSVTVMYLLASLLVSSEYRMPKMKLVIGRSPYHQRCPQIKSNQTNYQTNQSNIPKILFQTNKSKTLDLR
jgi:hypothetical protein